MAPFRAEIQQRNFLSVSHGLATCRYGCLKGRDFTVGRNAESACTQALGYDASRHQF